jgi:hypothetical protein
MNLQKKARASRIDQNESNDEIQKSKQNSYTKAGALNLLNLFAWTRLKI